MKKKQLDEMIDKMVKAQMGKKEMLKEETFQSIQTTEQERTSIYGLIRQIIQNCEILQEECKQNTLTIEGIEAYIEIVKRNNQKVEQFLNKKKT